MDLLIKFKSPSLYLYAELSDALEFILGMKVDIVSASARKRPVFFSALSDALSWRGSGGVSTKYVHDCVIRD